MLRSSSTRQIRLKKEFFLIFLHAATIYSIPRGGNSISMFPFVARCKNISEKNERRVVKTKFRTLKWTLADRRTIFLQTSTIFECTIFFYDFSILFAKKKFVTSCLKIIEQFTSNLIGLFKGTIFKLGHCFEFYLQKTLFVDFPKHFQIFQRRLLFRRID